MSCIYQLYRKERGLDSDRESAFSIWVVYSSCIEKRGLHSDRDSAFSIWIVHSSCIEQREASILTESFLFYMTCIQQLYRKERGLHSDRVSPSLYEEKREERNVFPIQLLNTIHIEKAQVSVRMVAFFLSYTAAIQNWFKNIRNCCFAEAQWPLSRKLARRPSAVLYIFAAKTSKI